MIYAQIYIVLADSSFEPGNVSFKTVDQCALHHFSNRVAARIALALAVSGFTLNGRQLC